MPQKVLPVLVELATTDLKRDYFVGASLDDVLRDTGGGIKFADTIYSSHRVVDPSQIQGLNRRLYTLGSRCVQRGTSKSFSKH